MTDVVFKCSKCGGRTLTQVDDGHIFHDNRDKYGQLHDDKELWECDYCGAIFMVYFDVVRMEHLSA